MQTIIRLPILAALTALTAIGCKSGHPSGDHASGSLRERNPLVPRQFGPNYKYNELMIKDYDEMLAMVQEMSRSAQAATSSDDSGGEGEAVEWYGRALKLIFSRPDSDNMVAKLLSEIRRDLQGFNAYEDSIAGLADEAVQQATDKNASVTTQSTAMVILENILGEIKPGAENGNADLRRIVEKVRAADISISSDVKKDRRMRGMFRTKNPSEEAAAILKRIEEARKKKR